MTIKSLIKAIPPPAKPTYAFDGPWEPIEAELGTPLPQDYKDLVRLYGFGTFMGCLTVYAPTAPYPQGQLVQEAFVVQRDFTHYHPHLPMYPKPGGLLVCGNIQDVGYLFWLTRGPVDEWPIVIWDHDSLEGEELEVLEYDLTDFLGGIVTGDIRPRALPDAPEAIEGEPPFKSDPMPD